MNFGNYSENELTALGIKFGENVVINESVQFFGAQNISIGSNVRIDCFSLISADKPVRIGNFVHIAAGTYLFGTGGIDIADYAGISSRVCVYSGTDDYSSGAMTNPTVPEEFRNMIRSPISIQRHVVIGAGCVIMPGTTIRTGASVGAMSFVNKNIPEYSIVTGNPLRRIGFRNREKLLSLERAHAESLG